MAQSAVEKRYTAQREAALAEVRPLHPTAEFIVSFGEHDCIVDVLIPGAKNVRYVHAPEDESGLAA